ncbi:MFS transporter [Estrella lausannensis]|uniref:Uncharacterized protein n=1 Tax=Estrella lausannensis TaxID=483423 RepID=A0A0H5DPR8_9BACT|nr:MFS transporter [Estrella lausannensis]CRX37494.1 hypothetical protein ELAC_0132 [Estrella lausannensis]
MRPLTALNLTQFFGAFNDNLFKFALVFLFIDIEGKEKSHEILSLASALFVLPFILLGAPAGQLTDKYSKSRFITLTALLELGIISAAFFGVAYRLKGLSFFLLFMMSVQSALFGPAKYGIIPELVAPQDISRANGVITSSTFLAIIFGSGAASLILDLSGNNYTLLMLIAILISTLGVAASLFIPHTAPAKHDGHFDPFIFRTIRHALSGMKERGHVLTAALASAYFLFIASYMQLNMIPFAVESLSLDPTAGGYLFFLTSLGIASGAYAVGNYSAGRVHLDWVAPSCMLVGAALILLDLLSNHLWLELILLPLAGFFGGIYQIPIDAYIQVASPKEKRGLYIGTTSLLGFVGVLVSSVLIYGLKEWVGFAADQGFTLMGIVTVLVGIILRGYLKLPRT